MAEFVDHFADYVSDDASDDLSAVGDALRTQASKSEEFLSSNKSRLNKIESTLAAELDRISGCLAKWQSTFADVQEFHRTAEEERQEADKAKESVEELQLKTQRQRRELAEKFAGRRKIERGKTAETIQQLQSKVQQLQEEVDQVDAASLEAKIKALDKQLAEEVARGKRLENEARTSRDELVESRTESGNLRQQVARSRTLLDERNEQIKSLRKEIEKLTNSASEEDRALHEELERLRGEKRKLHSQLEELRSKPPSTNSTELEDLRSKYEIAVENVRALKSRNEELERSLTEGIDASDPGNGFDWEAKKRELMAGEPGEAGDAADSAQDKAQLERAMKMTDRVLAQKDKKIAELKAQFEAIKLEQKEASKSSGTDQPSMPTADKQEIDKLKQELREKLRAAEVDISVERAQNARVRADLEEKMRDLDAQLALAKKQMSVRSQDQKSGKGWFRR